MKIISIGLISCIAAGLVLTGCSRKSSTTSVFDGGSEYIIQPDGKSRISTRTKKETTTAVEPGTIVVTPSTKNMALAENTLK